jgi:hypothetical protein
VCVQGFKLPDEFTRLREYIKTYKSRASWLATDSGDEQVVIVFKHLIEKFKANKL